MAAISEEKATEHLLSEIGTFQRDVFSVVQKRIGFCFLVLGWLITSEGARCYLHENPGIMLAGGIVVFLSTAQFLLLVRNAGMRSAEMAASLEKLGVSTVLYSHRVFNRRQVVSLSAFNVLVGLLIVLLLVFIRCSP